MAQEEPLKGWNHLPDLPLTASPLFQWPPRPLAALKWWLNGWFLISEKLIIVAVTFATLTWFQPPLDQTKTLSLAWILPMYLRNLILMTAIAGSLTCSSTHSLRRANASDTTPAR